MSAPTDERDPVVARALRDLEAPAATPQFWDRLEASLARVDGASRTPGPGTGETPVIDRQAQRRPSQSPRRTRMLAAAAVVAVLLGAFALVSRTAGDGGTADDSGAVDAPDTTAATTPPTTAPTPTTAAPPEEAVGEIAEPQSAEEAVLAWVDALGRGDAEAAAMLLGPGTITYVESQASTPVAAMGELMEGYGSWAGSTDRTTTEVTVTSSGEGSIVVVVLTGTRTAEGMEEFRVDAVPVRGIDGRFRVEPLAFGPGESRIEMISPAAGPDGLAGVPPDSAIELVAPGAEVVTISVDDGDVFAPAVGADGRVRFDPPTPLSTGTHLLVVASIGPHHLTALAGTFVVEG